MYEMYVVKWMQEQDNNVGVPCKVEKHNKTQNRIRFKKDIAKIGDEVYIITTSEQSKIKSSENTINVDLKKQLQSKDAEIQSLNKKIDELKQHQEQNNAENKSIDAYKQELESKYEIIDGLTTSNNEKNATIDELTKSNNEKDAIITELKTRIDELGIITDNSISESEYGSLKEQLNNANKELEYWQNAFGEINEKNVAILDENDSLKKDNTTISETNKMLNAHNIALTSTFDETKEQMLSDFEKQEKELKETIKNNQLHIDELTQKYQSLLPLKEYIPVKQHYDEINALKSKLTDVENELNKTNAEIETKLATQKSDLEIQHTNEKAKMLVAYNKDINQQKMKYNELANEYNNLLSDTCSLSRLNTLWNGKHNIIVENRTPFELEVIQSEQLPSDKKIIEYVPKD